MILEIFIFLGRFLVNKKFLINAIARVRRVPYCRGNIQILPINFQLFIYFLINFRFARNPYRMLKGNKYFSPKQNENLMAS